MLKVQKPYQCKKKHSLFTCMDKDGEQECELIHVKTFHFIWALQEGGHTLYHGGNV